MSLYKYRKFKICIDPDSKKVQGLKVGDVVRRQYFDNPDLIYTLMIVTETGVDTIAGKKSDYFIGAVIEGDEPNSGEILDFVRITNLYDPERSGALYLTASDSFSPYMDVIDGSAFDNSLCFPTMAGGSSDKMDINKYSVIGKGKLNILYIDSHKDVKRILRLSRNQTENSTNQPLGIQQAIGSLVNGERIVISYKIRGSKDDTSNYTVQLGDFTVNMPQPNDGMDEANISTNWCYRLHVISIDISNSSKTVLLDLSAYLNSTDDWCEIAELNVVRQSDIASFGKSTKTRIGKIQGILDPVFGILDGYGAYFQNVYATKNINIAGTLTAGDENGFSSTFYVGKIHKNVIIDSTNFKTYQFGNGKYTNDQSPVGIGLCCTTTNAIFEHVLDFGIQTADWRKENVDLFYCLSFWARSNRLQNVKVYQDEYHLQDIVIDSENWIRYSIAFKIQDSTSDNMSLRFEVDSTGLIFSAPQLEYGKTASQYQPTDGVLSYVEDYGAWFSKGGVGGTIQNPLLKLNEDGSISSRNNSFVIKPDGTGYFANGRFSWTHDEITLQDVTIHWENLSEEAKENLKSRTVEITGANIFHYSDELDESIVEPKEIILFGVENNFIPTVRSWLYFDSNGNWKALAGTNSDSIKILPAGHYWEGRNTLTLKYSCRLNMIDYENQFTISKLFDGESTYSIYITSSNGNVFRNGIISTMLYAHVYRGGEEITEKIPDNNFQWIRSSGNTEMDNLWNAQDHSGKTLQISGNDVDCKAVFDCEVTIST